MENLKLLGVWIDHHLTWEYHVQTLLSKLS